MNNTQTQALTYEEQVAQVRKEALKAYSDCHGKNKLEGRDLDWRAPFSLRPKEAMEIMEKATPFGYNDFLPSVIGKLPNDCLVFLSREGSVCIYVVRGKKKLPKMNSDERHYYRRDSNREKWFEAGKYKSGGFKGEYRFWWD